MRYKTIVGFEIHVELLTDSKAFCSCKIEFGESPNTNVCPICLGLPGALPKPNKKIIEYGIRAGIALNSEISKKISFDRKNYFYPDLVKGYQISQYDNPLCKNGYISINHRENQKKIRINRIHLEEDTGKTLYLDDGTILLDYNRGGIPLIEIVTEPDINSSEEAELFLHKLKAILEYIEISDCKMEEGSLRCDVNINVIDTQENNSTKIVEIKNLNSFKAVAKAIEYEEKRHISILQKGNKGVRETRRWDENKKETKTMRVKEGPDDYRYFYEADILQTTIDDYIVKEIIKEIPELPDNREKRFMREYSLSNYDSGILTSDKRLADFFEAVVALGCDPKQTSNWIMGDILKELKANNIDIVELPFTPRDFSMLIKLINKGDINSNIAKKVLKIMFKSGRCPEEIIRENEMTQINDEDILKSIIMEILEKNQAAVEEYKGGKTKVLGFLVGGVMKKTQGKSSPTAVKNIINSFIGEE